MAYETVIGLEVHVHLKTKTKAFCGCSTEFGNPPNTQVCPVCLGFPGSLPVLNTAALDHAIKVGIALNCTVQEYTKFDRKHYYYPDLPKNYQISQYDLPVSKDGFLDVGTRRIRIKRAHLEEDAGKLMHASQISLVDFNRSGVPLLEIVSEPDIRSPQEAYEYLAALKSILEYLEVSDCDMEKGSLRCDANVSIRPQGSRELGTKTELKNMNSFKAVKDALAFEITRQTELVEQGGQVVQDTRLWDPRESKTVSMRTKEEAKDYRYFPEPDLPPFIISKEKVEAVCKTISELPKEKLQRFVREYGLLESDARILVANKKDADYAEGLMRAWPDKNKKPVVNWLIGPLAAAASDHNTSISGLNIPGGNSELIKLVAFVEEGKVSNLTAKEVFSDSLASGTPASGIIQQKNLFQVSDTGTLDTYVQEAIRDNAPSVLAYRSGKANALMFLVGQVMKKTGGKANPKVVQEILKRRLDNA
ncbi:MAG TPA: Asp-tRNA(Asn)/Glu-tRNA(Gln) amidotransferase subunit GatB [Patescibacteria group bacterium]|nr:Asp-tRNA(Asn)/Glu-tRNA(Gln) amidotransferase subunit GatB [Patescibacteria group bacterium]